MHKRKHLLSASLASSKGLLLVSAAADASLSSLRSFSSNVAFVSDDTSGLSDSFWVVAGVSAVFGLASGLAPAKAPNPNAEPLMMGLDETDAEEAAGEADPFSEWWPPMLEPRLLGWMPEPLFAANAEKPPLLGVEEDPEEEGTALKGEDFELKAEKVGCVRTGASCVALAVAASAATAAAGAASLLGSAAAGFVAEASAVVSSFSSAAVASVLVSAAACASFVLNSSTFLRICPTFSVSAWCVSASSSSSCKESSTRFFLVGMASVLREGVS